MTILFTHISTDPFAGSTKSFLILIKGVIASGVRAIVVIPDTEGICDMLKAMGAEVIVQNFKGCVWTGARTWKHKVLYVPRQLGRIVINFFACRNLEKQLENVDFDLVHSNCTVSPLGRHIARKRHVPHVYHIREYGDKDFGLRYFPTNRSFRKYLKSKGVYSICITKDVQRHHGLENHPASCVVYNGIIQNVSEPTSQTSHRDGLLFAGRIEPTKGLHKLVAAYKEYADQVTSPMKLRVAGESMDDGYMAAIQKFIAKHHLSDHIEFLGKVSNMPALYHSSMAIVIPSEFEAFGRCMPEAMAYGCLAIGHNTGGTKEQLDNGLELCGEEIGIRYDNDRELPDALLCIHQMCETEATAMRDRAYRCVTQLYTDKAYVSAVLNFYKEIIP